jgi:hypothetical protein
MLVESPTYPVAAVMPPPNKSCVLDLSGSDLSKDSDDDVSDRITVPFSIPHLEWKCMVKDGIMHEPSIIEALLDDGSHAVLIDGSVVD